MTFDQYMEKNHPNLDTHGVASHLGVCLKSLWDAAQRSMLNDAVRGLSGVAPVPCRVITGKELRELMQDKIRVWLDDVRPMPKEGFDVHVKTAEEAMALIQNGQVAFMSFDHDLGDPNAKTGYDVAKLVERLAFDNKLARFEWAVHSMNPEGAHNIVMAMQQAEKFWNGHTLA